VKGVRAVPYRLPELIAAVAQGKTIFITEGEKASDAVATLGAVATTNAGGSKKIRNELVPFFKGADVGRKTPRCRRREAAHGCGSHPRAAPAGLTAKR